MIVDIPNDTGPITNLLSQAVELSGYIVDEFDVPHAVYDTKPLTWSNINDYIHITGA